MSKPDMDNQGLGLAVDPGAPFESRIMDFKEKFHFHQLMKESAINKHYIVEDISNIPNIKDPIFYYLKQTRYPSFEEHQFAKRYYNKFYQYCHSPFAKTDIAKLVYIYFTENEAENYYELVTIYEYGDSDRIDIENIDPDQTLRFLKNICLLLEDVHKYNNLSHGNLLLKNMVLVSEELKLSGFKPVFQEKKSTYKSWKLELARQYGGIRLDLFMVGIMWMTFSGVNTQSMIKPSLEMDRVLTLARNEAKKLNRLPKHDLLMRLIEVAENPIMSIDSVAAELDEHFVMEEIKAKHTRNPNNDTLNENTVSNSFSHANFNVNENTNGKISNTLDSGDERKLKKSESKLSNPFTRAYKDSENDLSQRHDGTKRDAHDNHSASHRGKNSEFLIQGNEYSLKPKESFGDLNSLRQSKHDANSLSDIRFDTGDFLDDLRQNPALSVNKGAKIEERYNSLNPNRDSSLRSAPSQLLDDGKKISLDDLADGRGISFRNTNLNYLDINLRESLHNNLKRESARGQELLHNSQHAKYSEQSNRDLKRDVLTNARYSNDRNSLSKKTSRDSLGQNDIRHRESTRKANDKSQERESLSKTSNSQNKASLKNPNDFPNQRESKASLKNESQRESFKKPSEKILHRESTKKLIKNDSVKKTSGASKEPLPAKPKDSIQEKQFKERESMQSKQSNAKNSIASKANAPNIDSVFEAGIHNKLFGNKNSISNQILKERTSTLDKGQNQIGVVDQPNRMSSKDNKGQNQIGIVDQPNRMSSKDNNRGSSQQPNLVDQPNRMSSKDNNRSSGQQLNVFGHSMPKKDSYEELIQSLQRESARNNSKSQNKGQKFESNKGERGTTFSANLNSNPRNGDYESRRSGLNHRLVEESLGKELLNRNSKSHSVQKTNEQFNSNQQNQPYNQQEEFAQELSRQPYRSPSREVQLRNNTDIRLSNENSAKILSRENSVHDQPSRNNSMAKSTEKPRRSPSNSRPGNSQNYGDSDTHVYHDQLRQLSENLLTSDLVGGAQSKHQLNPSDYDMEENHKIKGKVPVNAKLLQPVLRTDKSLKHNRAEVQRTFTNLDPRAREKSPIRRKNLEEDREEQDQVDPMTAIRAKIRDALKVELSDFQKKEIIAKVQREQQKTMHEKLQRTTHHLQRLIKKAQAEKYMTNKLESNIKELAQQKKETKRIKDGPEFRRELALQKVLDPELFQKEYEPVQIIAEAIKRQNEKAKEFNLKQGYDTFVTDNDAYVEIEEQERKGPSKSPVRNARTQCFDEMSKNANQKFKLSPLPSRDKFFTYNHEHAVKKIPFRRVVEKFHKPIDDEIEELKSRITKTGSVANMNPSNNQTRGINPSISAKSFVNKGQSAINNYFFKNYDTHDLKEQLENIAAFETLKPVTPLRVTKGESEKNQVRNSRPTFDDQIQQHLQSKNMIDLLISQPDFTQLEEDPILLITEIQAHTIYSPKIAFNIPDDVLSTSPKLTDDLATIKLLHADRKIGDLFKLIDKSTSKYSGISLVEMLKLKSFAHFHLENYPEAKKTLLEATKLLKQKIGPTQKDLYFAFFILNLAFLELHAHDFEEAISILNNEIFDDAAFRPHFYYNFLGNCHFLKEDFANARIYYAEQIKVECEKSLVDQEVIGNIFGLIVKVQCCLRLEQQKVEAARFYQSLEEPFKKLVTISKGLNLEKYPQFKGLNLKLVFMFLKFGVENNNGGLLNFVLQRSLDKKLIDPLAEFSEEQKTVFCSYLIFTCNYLKAKPNYGNFEKNYVRYLDLGKKIISSCDLNVDNLRTNLSLLFNKGLYCLHAGQTEKAQTHFDKCIKLYDTFFENSSPEMFDMLFQIGLTIVSLKRDSQAAYFFEKIIALNCPIEEIKEESTRQLAKIYFRLERFQECAIVLRNYLEQILYKYDPVSFGKRVFKDVCMLFVASEKARSEDFSPIREHLVTKLLFSQKVYMVRYLELFSTLRSIRFRNLPQPSREDMWRDLNEVLNDDELSAEDQLLKLVAFATLTYKSLLEDSDYQGQENGLNMLQLLKDQGLTNPENAEIIHQFAFNFMFMLVNMLPESRSSDKQTKEQVIDKLLAARSYEKHQEVIAELIYHVKGISVESISGKIEKLTKGSKQAGANKSPVKQETGENHQFELPIEFRQAIDELDVSREFCKCTKIEEETYGVTMLIEQFFKQLKNMLFLDINDNIIEYYQRFQDIITEKSWNWSKFTYVKTLFDFHIECETEHKINKAVYVKLLDSILESRELCIHDLKLIVLLLESFKNVEYLEIFVMYLDRFHSTVAAVIFNVVFMKNFNQKCSFVISNFYKKVYSYRFYHLENYALMHCVGIENVLEIEKEFDFRIYARYRYDCLANHKLRALFEKYISKSTLLTFDLQYALYNSIVLLLKKNPDNQYETLHALQSKLAQCHSQLPLSKTDYSSYLYDLYLVVNVMNLQHFPETAELIVEILIFLEDKVAADHLFHFIILCSLTGNFFCKYNIPKASIKLKLMALSALKKLVPGPVAFPPHVLEMDLKNVIFSILSFLVVDYVELKKFEEAEVFLSKLLEYKFENGMLDLEKLLLNFWFEYNNGEVKQSIGTLELAQKLFDKMQLNDFLTKMFKATIDKMWYLVAVKYETAAVAERKRVISEASLTKLLTFHK